VTPLAQRILTPLFREQLDLMLRLARRNGTLTAVVMADTDDFRRIKNSLGHRQSDAFIKTVALRLAAALRDSDVLIVHATADSKSSVARVTGSEFAIVLGGLNEPHGALRVAQRLREAAGAPVTIGGSEIFPSMSLGVALFPGDGETSELLSEHAELALGQAKDGGKNQVRFYDSSMERRASDRLSLESSLRHAIEERELFPVYQPRIDARTGLVCGIEALVRWRHPERGVLAPAEFLEVAERSRLIVPLGEYMLEAACRQNLAWQQAGLPGVPMSVNISATQVAQPDFVHTIARVLEQTGLRPEWLELEITESVMMQDAAVASRVFLDLKKMGVRISIDDFGTGFASLSYLRDFDFDVLKIDRSFVSGLPRETRTAALTCAIIELSRRLGLDVVAEGVENAAQATFLDNNGCHLMQGFGYCKPIVADELSLFWAECMTPHSQQRLAAALPA